MRRWIGSVLAVLIAVPVVIGAQPFAAEAATTKPAVTSVSPTSGPTAGGTRITLHGAHFTKVTKVLFGSTAGKSLSVSSGGTLKVTAPSHAAGRLDIRVVSSYGTSPAVTADRYTYVAPSAIGRLSVTSGPVAGGNRITITGSGFTKISKVLFGSTAGKSLSVASSTALTVTVPAHAVGGVDVRVVGSYGTSPVVGAGRYTYVAVAAVTGVSPNSGSTAGGTKVTVRGSAFTGVSRVLFGTVAGLSPAVGSSGAVTVTAPAHAAGAVDVRVVTSYGTSPVGTADRFTYVAPPTVTGVSPSSGTGAGGTKVTITGAGLSAATQVLFGGTAGTSVVVASATQLSVVAPAHPAGTVDVTVTGPGGTSAAVPFTYATPACVPVVKHVSGNVSGTWSPACVSAYVLDGTGVTVETGTTLTIASGTVVQAGSGTRMIVAGTLTADGAEITGPAGSWYGIDVSPGGSVSLDHTTFAGGPIYAEDNVGSVNLTDSTFTGPAAITIGRCGAGTITGNRFAGASVISRCGATIRDNQFDHTDNPLSITGGDLTAAPLNSNTFTGTGNQVRVDISFTTVPAGKTVTVGPGLVLHPSYVTVGGTLVLEAGAVVATANGDNPLTIVPGGLLKMAGTAAVPVVATSITDGAAAGGLGAAYGGALEIEHADFRGLLNPIGSGYHQDGYGEVTIRDSSFEAPGSTTSTAQVAIGGCSSGEMSGNTFTGTELNVSNCTVPIHDNRFVSTHRPLTIESHDDLAEVPFSGSTANTFTGTGDELRADLDKGRVRSGTQMAIDPATGVVLHPSGVTVEGTVVLQAGTVVKTDMGSVSGSDSFSVSTGGSLKLAGTTTAPVVATALADDTAGGDTNGDGAASAPTAGSLATGLALLDGGSLDAEYTNFRWLLDPIAGGDEPATQVTIRGSTFDTPSPITTSGFTFDTATVGIGGCAGGEISANTFQRTRLRLGDCPAVVYANKFIGTHNPLSVSSDDVAAVDLAGQYTNTFLGTGDQRRVDLSAAKVADGTTLRVDGADSHAVLDLSAPIGSGHSLATATGSVQLSGGVVVKGTGPLFDLGPYSSFTVTGTSSAPVVFAPSDDDSVAGDTNGDGDTGISHRLSAIFKSDQSASWLSVPASAVGVDLSRLGPGWTTVDHAVVRHTDEAFAGCLVCELTVHHTDFIDTVTGISQSFYQMPLAPCLPLMGRALLTGGNPVWQRADATGNYWGGAGGPSTDINWDEVAATVAGQAEQYNQLVDALPLDQAGPLRTAFENMATQQGDKIPNVNLTGYAAAQVSVESCTVPVVNVTFPLLIVPENFGGWSDTPINDQSALPGL